MFSLSMVDKKGSFFVCLLTVCALWSSSKTGTVFVEVFWDLLLHKKNFFFSPATDSLKSNSRKNFSSCSENGSNFLDKWLMVEKVNE